MKFINCLIVLVAALTHSLAVEAQEIACSWQPLSPTVGTTDAAAREAAKFFSKPTELAYFRILPDRERVENADPHKTQEIIFPSLRLSAYPERLAITAPNPNIAGLKGRNAQIHIEINRYTLRSTMALEMSEKSGGRTYGFWLRDGQCFRKEL